MKYTKKSRSKHLNWKIIRFFKRICISLKILEKKVPTPIQTYSHIGTKRFYNIEKQIAQHFVE